MTPPEPESAYYVASPIENFGRYVDGILKLDGVLVNTYATLTDGTVANTWTLGVSDQSFEQVYLTAGFYVINNTAYLQIHANDKLYRYNGSAWECLNGTTEAYIVQMIENNKPFLGLDNNLYNLFANGSVAL